MLVIASPPPDAGGVNYEETPERIHPVIAIGIAIAIAIGIAIAIAIGIAIGIAIAIAIAIVFPILSASPSSTLPEFSQVSQSSQSSQSSQISNRFASPAPCVSKESPASFGGNSQKKVKCEIGRARFIRRRRAPAEPSKQDEGLQKIANKHASKNSKVQSGCNFAVLSVSTFAKRPVIFPVESCKFIGEPAPHAALSP